jgi:hypothetical protein
VLLLPLLPLALCRAKPVLERWQKYHDQQPEYQKVNFYGAKYR